MLCGLVRGAGALFTLHSLKRALLCGGNQLHISKALRASQGHHRYAGVSGAVQLYGRDDVVGQIKFPRSVRKAVCGGWIASIPLRRGVTRLVGLESLRIPGDACVGPATALASSETADGSEKPEDADEDGPSVVLSDASSQACDDETVAEEQTFSGPWLLNSKTGWFRRAVKIGDADHWSLACRQRAAVQEQDVLNCGHSGCRGSQCSSSAQGPASVSSCPDERQAVALQRQASAYPMLCLFKRFQCRGASSDGRVPVPLPCVRLAGSLTAVCYRFS